MVDNFELIGNKLTFIDPYDRYVCHILRRVKDKQNEGLKACGSNEAQRLLRTYYFGDIEYFKSKIPAIKELCDTNGARAYILPQVRNNRDCLINLGKLVFENLDNPTIKLDGITRKAVCSCHTSRDKKWIVDFDEWSLGLFDSIQADIAENLKTIGKNPENDMYVVPTVHGKHIVVSPFNSAELLKKHPFVFCDQKKGFDLDILKKLFPDLSDLELENLVFAPDWKLQGMLNSTFLENSQSNDPRVRELANALFSKKVTHVGLLHKDGATLLYAP